MYKFKLFLFVIFSLMQISVCVDLGHDSNVKNKDLEFGSRSQLLIELAAKILQLKFNISTISLAEGNAIQDDKNYIKLYADGSVNNVEVDLEELDELVKNSTKAAKQAKKNINPCITDEKKQKNSRVNIKDISKCVKISELNVVDLKLAKLAGISAGSDLIIPTCAGIHPLNDEKLEQCVLKAIQDAAEDADYIKNKINDEAHDILLNQLACISNKRESLEAAIQDISNDFSDCVTNIK